MWKTKVWKFNTKRLSIQSMNAARARMLAWIERNEGRIQYEEIFVNNAYAVTYRPLRWIG
jgi:hypothetical protein